MSIVALVNKTVVEATNDGPVVKAEVTKREVIESREVVNLTIINESGPLVEAELIGAIDGQNRIFTTPTAYVSGSTKLYKNGLRMKRDKDFFERGGSAIELTNAPRATSYTDELIIEYRERVKNG